MYAMRRGMDKIRVDEDDARRFETWLDARLLNGLETGSLKKGESWSVKFNYLVQRCIDAESKLSAMKKELRAEKVLVENMSVILAEKEEKIVRLERGIEALRFRVTEVENENFRGVR